MSEIQLLPDQPETLESLVEQLTKAKFHEEREKKLRIAIEEAITERIPGPDIGQVTELVDGVKVTVKRGFNYKADIDKIQRVFTVGGYDYPEPIKIKTTIELDPAGYEWYRINQPDIFPAIAEHVVVTPKKTSVTLKA